MNRAPPHGRYIVVHHPMGSACVRCGRSTGAARQGHLQQWRRPWGGQIVPCDVWIEVSHRFGGISVMPALPSTSRWLGTSVGHSSWEKGLVGPMRPYGLVFIRCGGVQLHMLGQGPPHLEGGEMSWHPWFGKGCAEPAPVGPPQVRRQGPEQQPRAGRTEHHLMGGTLLFITPWVLIVCVAAAPPGRPGKDI